MVYTVDTVHSIETANAYTYIVLGKVRTLLEWADQVLSKMLGDWTVVDTP